MIELSNCLFHLKTAESDLEIEDRLSRKSVSGPGQDRERATFQAALQALCFPTPAYVLIPA